MLLSVILLTLLQRIFDIRIVHLKKYLHNDLKGYYEDMRAVYFDFLSCIYEFRVIDIHIKAYITST
jgi:hypothetical protein